MIKPTTALRKISSLRKRIWGIQGGQGAGKTFSILLLLINHALRHSNKEIYISSAELSKMRLTVIKDFVKIMKMLGRFDKNAFTAGTLYVFPNGSFIKFIGLDKEDIGKGLRSDIMFVNEANKLKSFETYRELTSRAKRVIIDFNPNAKFWFHTEVMSRSDCDFIVLTFRDNEYLSKEEVNEILHYKKKGYDAAGNVINEYWANKWRIYGLGEVGSVEGRIFNWKPISYRDFLSIDRPVYYSVDWGKVDPFAIGCEKYHDGVLYTHELNYDSENEWRKRLTSTQIKEISGSNDDGFVNWMFKQLAIPKDRPVICDNNRPTKIISLRNAGWEYAIGPAKAKIIDRLDIMQNLDIRFTEDSINIDNEQGAYCWATDRFGEQTGEPVDYSNHHIDRIGYTCVYLQNEGVIRKV